MSATKHLIRIIMELIATALIWFLPIRIYRWWGPPTKRGFFCNDESLMYPYHEDTIPTYLLYLLAVGIPVTIVITCEVVCSTFKQNHGFWRCLLKCHDTLIPLAFAIAAEHLISTVAKFTVGRLRPHFLEVCHPVRLDNTTCSNPNNHGIFIEDYSCCPHTPNVTSFMRLNQHLSFPSGHSSLIFLGMIFSVLYLQRFSKRLHQSTKWNVGLLLPILQMLCVIVATFVAASRVKDYKHHWSDVLAGMLLGSLIAIAATFYVQEQHIRVEKSLSGNASVTSTPDTSNKPSFFISRDVKGEMPNTDMPGFSGSFFNPTFINPRMPRLSITGSRKPQISN